MLLIFSLRVVFVLSTIVLVTDCCSSRILLPKNHSLRVVDREKEQEHLLPKTEFKQIEDNRIQSIEFIDKNVDDGGLNLTEKSLLDPGAVEIRRPPLLDVFISNGTVRAQQDGNPNYHIIDMYYKIMRDVMSFECTAPFLTEFCLNKGRCFEYPIGNNSFLSCECADGFVGERCESKSINVPDVYSSPTTAKSLDPRYHAKILSARVVFSYPMLIAISSIYLLIAGMVLFRCPRKD